MKKFLTILLFLAVLGAALGIIVLSNQENKSKEADIATTIHPIYAIAKEVAGDELTVARILAPGASPHTYEPTPRDLRTLSNVSRVYAIGHELDNWVLDMAPSEGLILTVDEGIELREYDGHHHDDHGHEADHAHDDHGEHEHEESDKHDHDHKHGEFDPHYWLSTKNAAIIASTIASDLSELYPESANAFAVNAADFITELSEAKTAADAKLRGIENRNIITLHEAWYYFAEDFNLIPAGSFEPTPGREPTASDIAELTDLVDETGVRTIYTEIQLGDIPLKSFAEDQGLTVAELDPLGGTEGRESYIDLINYNVDIIANNQ